MTKATDVDVCRQTGDLRWQRHDCYWWPKDREAGGESLLFFVVIEAECQISINETVEKTLWLTALGTHATRL